MSVGIKNGFVLAANVIAVTSALLGLAFRDYGAMLGALGIVGLLGVFLPKSTSSAWGAIATWYVAFADWTTEAGIGLTVAAVSGLFVVGWLQRDASYFRLSIWVFAQGLSALFVIGLPLYLRSSSESEGKAPQGLPSVEASRREADELILTMWLESGEEE